MCGSFASRVFAHLEKEKNDRALATRSTARSCNVLNVSQRFLTLRQRRPPPRLRRCLFVRARTPELERQRQEQSSNPFWILMNHENWVNLPNELNTLHRF